MSATDDAGSRRSSPAGGQPDKSPLDIIPQSAGPRLTTFLGGAVHSIRPPGSQTFQSDDHFAAVMLAPSPGISSAFGSDKPEQFDAPRGMVVVSPARWFSRMSWGAVRENTVIAMKPSRLTELAEGEFDVGHVELQPPPFKTVDPVALHVAELLKSELAARTPTPNELYVDSLITVFGLHLLRNYSSVGARRAAHGGLSVRSAKLLEDFLDENFSRKLTINDLASVCGLSSGHFIRAFTRTFGQRPHQYLLNRRLVFAERMLVESEMTIAEIAHLSGFSSQSHLTSIMKRYRNTTPAQLHRRPGALLPMRHRSRRAKR